MQLRVIRFVIVSKKTKIRHRNGINETLADMPLGARRVLFLTLAQIDPKVSITRDATFRIYASDYAELCEIDKSVAYQQMKEAATQLQLQLLSVPRDQLLPPIHRAGDPLLPWKKPEGKGTRSMNITEYCDYMDGDGYIDIVFSRQMEPYICRIERDFTTQVLLSAVRISDTNASRLYQYLRQKISEKKYHFFDITLSDFRCDLGISEVETYKEFKHLNNLYFKRSVKKIIAKTEFSVITMEPIKRINRKISEVRISYEYIDV